MSKCYICKSQHSTTRQVKQLVHKLSLDQSEAFCQATANIPWNSDKPYPSRNVHICMNCTQKALDYAGI